MRHTIAAVYEDRNQARRAMDDLNADGFSPDDIYLTQSDAQGEQHQVDEGDGAFVSFFKNLFGYGDHDDDAELYSEAVRRGHYVLTVNVPDDDLVDRVSDLLEKNDPIDIQEQAQQWRSGGWAAPESMRAGNYDDTDALGIRRADSTGSDYLGQDPARGSDYIDSGDLQAAQADAGDQSLDMPAPGDNPGSRPAGSDYRAQDSLRTSDNVNAEDLQAAQADAGDQSLGMGSPGRDANYSDSRLTDSDRNLAADNLHSDNLRTDDLQGDRAIPVVEEELHVGKRQVQRGGVRVYQRVIDQPVNENVHLREEHIDVERRPVDRPASSADLSGLKDESYEVRASAEEPVIEKSARVVEEVVVGKTATERDQNISDTVRRTEVEVEQLSGQDGGRANLDGRDQFDQTMYRPHWDSTYASEGGRYEDWEPAYRYGSLLNTNDRYKGRSWDEIEPSVRDEWEAGNPGTWERIKAAVRHGWDKTMH